MATQTAKQTPPRQQDEVNKGRILAQWTFLEYEKYARGPLWYIVTIGLGLLLLWFAIRDGNFLFALMILLFALIIFTHHRSQPLMIPFVVYDAGIQIGDRFFLHREIESFSVIYQPPQVKKLYIVPRGAVLRREISIPLHNQNPLHIRALLLDFIDEDVNREEESSSDQFGRLLKL